MWGCAAKAMVAPAIAPAARQTMDDARPKRGMATPPEPENARANPGAGDSITVSLAPGMSYLLTARLAAQVTALREAVTILESMPTPQSTRPSAVSASM